MRIHAYVDGFNLYYGLRRWPGTKWLDVRALLERLFPADDVTLIRYFTASLKEQDDASAPRRHELYLRALAGLPGFEIHRSSFLVRRRWMPLDMPARWLVPVLMTEEKGSDVSLGSHMVWDAFMGSCDLAVVISNDSDLRDPVAMLQRAPLNIPVWVLNPHPRKAAALRPSVHLDLKGGDLRACQFPSRVALASGKILTKPEGW